MLSRLPNTRSQLYEEALRVAVPGRERPPAVLQHRHVRPTAQGGLL